LPQPTVNPTLSIRDLQSLDDFRQVEALEKEVWELDDLDIFPITAAIASRESGSIWIGAFEGNTLVGFAFGFLGAEGGRANIHSHMLAVRNTQRDSDLGHRLKLVQRERALALRSNGARIDEITWTFDPLQSRNAHFNFGKLGVVSGSYRQDFYGPETSSSLHRNSTDRLWVRWPICSRRVQDRLQGKGRRTEMLDTLSVLSPLVRLIGNHQPVRADLATALARQRIAIEIPSDIVGIEKAQPELAREWRASTRWAFTNALEAGFFVADYCRDIRGHQGPGAYILEKGPIEEFVPELAR
jgi:predicted GNAT superfamily acetyltransferase